MATLSEGVHLAWGSMVDACDLPGTGPLYHLRRLRGDGSVNESQVPRDLQRGEDPRDFTAAWLQGAVDADALPLGWAPGKEPALLGFSPAEAGMPRPRWFRTDWGSGLACFENGQRVTYERPADYWQSDFSIVVEVNTAAPRSDGWVAWGDPGLGWLKISGTRAAHFALARGSANPELHQVSPKHYPLGLVGHVRVAAVVSGDEVLVVVNGRRVYYGSHGGVRAPSEAALPSWAGIIGHGNNFVGEFCGGAHYLRALSLREAQAITET